MLLDVTIHALSTVADMPMLAVALPAIAICGVISQSKAPPVAVNVLYMSFLSKNASGSLGGLFILLNFRGLS
jgi:hypothetical protein